MAIADSPPFFGVTVDMLEAYWPHVAPYLTRALEHGDGCEDLGDVALSIAEGKSQLWVYVNGTVQGVVVTRIANYARKKGCIIHLCAGENLKEWFCYIAIIEAWAQEQGCTVVKILGRRGWEKWFPSWSRQVVLVKELGDG